MATTRSPDRTTEMRHPNSQRTAQRLARRAHLLADFLAVAAEGGIRQAAVRSNLSQSALSRRIQDLERELGASLFERSAQGMALTRFGAALQHHAQAINQSCVDAAGEIDELLDGVSGELRIGAGPAWAYALVPDAVGVLQSRYPGVRVTVLNRLNDSTLPMLAAGKLDLVLGGLPPESRRTPHLEYEPLIEVEHRIFASVAHPLARRRSVRAHDVQAMPWIWFVESVTARDFLGEWFARGGLELPRPAVQTSSVSFGFRLMQQRRHLMLLPSTLEPVAATARLRPLRTGSGIGRHVAGLMYRRSAPRLRAFSALREALLVEVTRAGMPAAVPMSG